MRVGQQQFLLVAGIVITESAVLQLRFEDETATATAPRRLCHMYDSTGRLQRTLVAVVVDGGGAPCFELTVPQGDRLGGVGETLRLSLVYASSASIVHASLVRPSRLPSFLPSFLPS